MSPRVLRFYSLSSGFYHCQCWQLAGVFLSVSFGQETFWHWKTRPTPQPTSSCWSTLNTAVIIIGEVGTLGRVRECAVCFLMLEDLVFSAGASTSETISASGCMTTPMTSGPSTKPPQRIILADSSRSAQIPTLHVCLSLKKTPYSSFLEASSTSDTWSWCVN